MRCPYSIEYMKNGWVHVVAIFDGSEGWFDNMLRHVSGSIQDIPRTYWVASIPQADGESIRRGSEGNSMNDDFEELVRLAIYGEGRENVKCGNVFFWIHEGVLCFDTPSHLWDSDKVSAELSEKARAGHQRALKIMAKG